MEQVQTFISSTEQLLTEMSAVLSDTSWRSPGRNSYC